MDLNGTLRASSTERVPGEPGRLANDVQQAPMATSKNADESLKMALAMMLVRSKLLQKALPRPSSNSDTSVSDTQQLCNRKAKDHLVPSVTDLRHCKSKANDKSVPSVSDLRHCKSKANDKSVPSVSDPQHCKHKAKDNSVPSISDPQHCKRKAKDDSVPSVSGPQHCEHKERNNSIPSASDPKHGKRKAMDNSVLSASDPQHYKRKAKDNLVLSVNDPQHSKRKAKDNSAPSVSEPQHCKPKEKENSAVSVSDPQHWKRKEKERKQEIIRLKEELKELQGNLNLDKYPVSAACKCYFFSDLGRLSPMGLTTDGSDSHLNDVLRRRFLRQVRYKERSKRIPINFRSSFSDLTNEEETESLRVSVNFLVDICSRQHVVQGPNFANLSHQAVDCIIGLLNQFLSSGKNVELIEGIVRGLILNLIKSMCFPMGEKELPDSETDVQIYIQHLLRNLGSVSYAGQLIILSVSQKIIEQAENMLFLDPFDDSFPHAHDSIFLMIQLIDFLVANHLLNWSKHEGFNSKVFQDWLTSIAQTRKALELLESQSGIYVVYMNRVCGELARLVGQVSSLNSLTPQILDDLFH